MLPAIDGGSLDPLHRAAFEADLPALRRLLEEGLNPDEPGCVRDESDGWRCNPGPSYVATPLMLAAASTSRDAAGAIGILLDAGADHRALSTRGDAVLWFAAAAGNTRSLRVLLERGASPDAQHTDHVTPICVAATTGNVNGVRLLLRFGASPHPVARNAEDDPVEPAYPYRIPLFAAAESGSAECVRLLIAAGARVATFDIYGRSALMYASTAEIVRALVAAGCAPDARETLSFGRSVVDLAAEGGHPEVLVALVEAGADINAATASGMNPLTHYCGSSNVSGEMVRAMIEAGADIHARWFRGATALHHAVQLNAGDRRGRLRDVIVALVEAGIDVNVRDDASSTPLHYAVGEEGLDLGAVQTLLELGADPVLKNDYGQTPLDLAPRLVDIWNRIVAEGLRVPPGLSTEENSSWIEGAIEEERAAAASALAEAVEAVRLLNAREA